MRKLKRETITVTVTPLLASHAELHPSQSVLASSDTVSVNALRATYSAPVVAQPQPSMQMLPPQLLDSVVGRHQGRYTGNAEDWPQWRRRWIPYLREVEGLWPGISDHQRLALLRSALDEAGQLMLEQAMEAAPDQTYEAYWANVDLESGAEDKEVLRRKLARLRVSHSGRLSEKACREFYAQASTLAMQIGDISDRELGCILTQAIPAHPFRRQLAQEEDRRKENGALLLDGLPEDFLPAEVEAMVFEETGARPISVKRMDRVVKVTPAGEDHRNAIKITYDRQRLAGGNLVKVSPDFAELGGRAVNDLMVRWLRVEQRVSAAPDTEPPRERERDRRPPPRWQREVDATSDSSAEEDPSVRAVEK